MEDTLIIDAWPHILPAPYFERLSASVSGPLSASVRFLASIPCLFDLNTRFRTMDRFPNYTQVLTLVPGQHLPLAVPNPALVSELVRLANDGMAELVTAYPDRFLGFAASLPMHNPDLALDELDRAIHGLGALGVQIEANINGVPLDDPRFEALFARMAALGRPIWIHPVRNAALPDYSTETSSRYALWQTFGWPYETAVCLSRLIIAGYLERYQGLRLIAHHGGGMIPHFAGRIKQFLEYEGPLSDPSLAVALQALKKPPIEYFKMLYVDTALCGDKNALGCVLDFFGVGHVLFGTDMPFDPEQGPGFVRDTIADMEALSLDKPALQRIYEGNARQVLRMK
jgi:predicted TIM-barrel fold metal-dependent hydrolase